jgi:hypothetical protein
VREVALATDCFGEYLLHPSIRGKGLAFDDADGGQWSHEFGVE